MAIYDFRTETSFPRTKTIDIDGTFSKVIVPSQVNRIQVGCSTHAIYVNTEVSDGDPATIDNSMFVPSGNVYSTRIGRGSSRNNEFYVSLQSAGSKKVSLSLEEL